VGTRYDLVLERAASATLDGVPLVCDTLDNVLVCAWTPVSTGSPLLAAAEAGCTPEDVATLSVVSPFGIVPRGDRYRMGLYEAQYTDEVATLADLRDAGVNAVQTYDEGDTLAAWQEEAAALGLACSLHVDDADEIAARVDDLSVGWWDLPEELPGGARTKAGGTRDALFAANHECRKDGGQENNIIFRFPGFLPSLSHALVWTAPRRSCQDRVIISA